MSSTKVEFLIVDTNGFLKNVPLQDYGDNIITLPSVMDEVKNKQQFKRLAVLPYDLKIKEVFLEDIKTVESFAKKTGDYASLSATDIRLIALTLRFEKEKVGTDHLKEAPVLSKVIVDSSKHKSDDQQKPLAGFYLPTEKSEKEAADLDIEKNEKEAADADIGKCEKETADLDIEEREQKLSDSKNESVEYSENECENLEEKFKNLNCDPVDITVDCGHDLTVDDVLKPVNEDDSEESLEESESSEENDEEDDDDDDEGWITPSNINNVKKEMFSDVIEEKPAKVACFTTDFAMQNVLMQMGLNVISTEGKVIKQMRTWILRCYACFKTTSDSTKLFCPHCGHKTLKKVSVSLDDKGHQKIHINFKKPLTSRGKKFSLPTFKGGKHAVNPILFADQPVPDQKPKKQALLKNDPLKENYVAGYSPFVMHDVTSKSAMLGYRPGKTITKHWMKRNPNEPARRRK